MRRRPKGENRQEKQKNPGPGDGGKTPEAPMASALESGRKSPR